MWWRSEVLAGESAREFKDSVSYAWYMHRPPLLKEERAQ